jgi:hypothetical protein
MQDRVCHPFVVEAIAIRVIRDIVHRQRHRRPGLAELQKDPAAAPTRGRPNKIKTWMSKSRTH